MKVFLGNELNDSFLDTLYFLVFKWFLFRVLFQFEWRNWNIWLFEIAPFDQLHFGDVLWGFLSIIIVIIVSANWRVVLDLKIPALLFLDTKLNTLFFQFVLV